MRLLLTNDDGYGADGIEALASSFSVFDCEIVAPDGERSGTSQTLTLVRPIRVIKKGENRYSCSGYPADCVMYSLLGILDGRPDAVISGINAGPNLGTDIIYSGTAGAARQAALWDVPAVAVSLCGGGHKLAAEDYEKAAAWLAGRFDEIRALWQPDTFININIPRRFDPDASFIRTYPSRRFYSDRVEKVVAADESEYYFLMGGPPAPSSEEGSDSHTVERGGISLSVIKIHPEAADGETE